jgi:hypothetical protein
LNLLLHLPCNKYCKASPVPTQTILTFRCPYTGRAHLHRSRAEDVCCLRLENCGSASSANPITMQQHSLYVTDCQFAPIGKLPMHLPLQHAMLPLQLGIRYVASGYYHGRTSTCKPALSYWARAPFGGSPSTSCKGLTNIPTHLLRQCMSPTFVSLH